MLDHGIAYRNDDSFCGPISMLTKVGEEEILLVLREAKQPPGKERAGHLDPTTRTSLIRSRDRGQTWFSQVTPDPGGGNGTSVAVLSTDEVLVNDFRWLFLSPEAYNNVSEPARFHYRKALDMYVAMGGVFMTRSYTHGYTWETPVPVQAPDGWPIISCAGAVLELPDGSLLLPLSARKDKDDNQQAVVMRSTDRGRTWGEAQCLTADTAPAQAYVETRLNLCPSGRILAMHRTQQGNFFRNVSSDGGCTWGAAEDTGVWCGGSSPPDLLTLNDGRILLTRGYRREPFGVRCNISEDEGEHWLDDIVLRDDGPDRDVGYPSTIQFADGELLTVYYWHNEGDHIRHLQRTRWSVPE